MTRFSNWSGYLRLNLYVEQISQDITNNTSRARWRATVDREGAYRTWTYGNISLLKVWLNGAYVYNSNLDFDTSGEEITLASGEITVLHDNEGNKTMDVWASFPSFGM